MEKTDDTEKASRTRASDEDCAFDRRNRGYTRIPSDRQGEADGLRLARLGSVLLRDGDDERDEVVGLRES